MHKSFGSPLRDTLALIRQLEDGNLIIVEDDGSETIASAADKEAQLAPHRADAYAFAKSEKERFTDFYLAAVDVGIYPGFSDPEDWGDPLPVLDAEGNLADLTDEAREQAQEAVGRVSGEHDAKHALRHHPWCGECHTNLAEINKGGIIAWNRPHPEDIKLAQYCRKYKIPTPGPWPTLLEGAREVLVKRAAAYLAISPEPHDAYNPANDSEDLSADDLAVAWERMKRIGAQEEAKKALQPEKTPTNEAKEAWLRETERLAATGSDLPASWAPKDLSAYLDGSHEAATPTLLPRTDGVALIYPGLVHSFHGESESGKSLLLQIESVRLILAGERVLFIDFESDPASIVERLMMLGATKDAVRERFAYVQPETSPTALHEIEAWQAMFQGDYALCVIDGVTDALAVFGQETKDNDSITKWMRLLPKAIARRTGAGVALVDHVTKDSESRGRFAIGGQAKMSGLTGAAYVVEIAEALGRGLRGVITIRVGKDRPGHIRGHSGPMRKSDRTQEAARVVIDSRVGDPAVTIEPPRDTRDEDGNPRAFRPTNIMEKVSKILEAQPQPMTFSAISKVVRGREEHVKTACEQLAEGGYVSRIPGARNSLLHQSIAEYRESADPQADSYDRSQRETVSPLNAS